MCKDKLIRKSVETLIVKGILIDYMSVIREGLELLQQDGPVEFIHGIQRYSHRKIALMSGDISLSTGGVTADFVAESEDSIAKTQGRLRNEGNQIRDMLDEVEPDDVFFDIGANTGIYSCFLAKKCSHVVAFEPYPPNVHELEKNAGLNGNNICIWNVALSDESGLVGFSMPDTPVPGYGTASIDSNGTEKVRSVRADELINRGELPQPNIVKIDVEGAEPLVINGLTESLSNSQCRIVYCELHFPTHSSDRGSIHDHGVEYADIIARFEQLGFDVEELNREGERMVLKAQRE